MKPEQNTDYELQKKQSKLILLFITVLTIGLVIILVLAFSTITAIANMSDELHKKHLLEIKRPTIVSQKEDKQELVAQKIIQEQKYEEVPVCNMNNEFKSYMDYRMINDSTTKQYALQQEATTNENGLRVYDGKIMVAMAGFKVGDVLKLTFEHGTSIKVIVGDIKANTNCLHKDGSLVEFIVNTPSLSDNVRLTGDLSELFGGKILKIEREL